MANVEVSAVASTSSSATVSLAVTRPRIKKISISGYRAFPPYRPTSIDVNLGDDGKNLLLYGENGSGKTSLFKALRELFSDSPEVVQYNDRRNVFAQEDDDSVVVQLTSGATSEFRWETGEAHPKFTGGAPFREFANSCLFLDYRDLLQTNFVHRSGSPELFDLLVKSILRDLPVPARKLSEVHQSMISSNPYRRTSRQVSAAQSCAVQLTQALKNHLPEVVTEGNRLLEKLQPGIQFDLQPGYIEYVKIDRDFVGQTVPLTVSYNGFLVSEPQHFLNEARLTALALSLYLAGAKVIRAGRPGILIMDDVLMGLDLSNRIPLLVLLKEEFSEWQVILITHDHTWYELAREYTEHAGGWCNKEMYLVEGQPGYHSIPEIKDGTSLLVRANAHLAANDLMAAAVYLRAAFEARLRNVCEMRGIEIPFKKQLKEVKADMLWSGILKRQEAREKLQQDEPTKNHPDFIERTLIGRVEMMRSTILNRLSHTDSPNFEKSEVETARDIVRDLSSYSFPPKNT
jgi:energy-coupling factor transporter ATP-binding protein EcfA2